MNKTIWGLAALAIAAVSVPAVPASAQDRGRLTWSGDVDDTAVVYIRRGEVRTETLRGKGVDNARHRFLGGDDRIDGRVRLQDENGRGSIRVVQQPSRDNDYTAAVRIEDLTAGRGRYRFTLTWDDRDNRNYRDDRGNRGDQGGRWNRGRWGRDRDDDWRRRP